MRFINEGIARQTNREDRVKGRFWEGRFKVQSLLDEGAVLACMAYVDLNPIRAGLAITPETSDYTSAQQRIEHRSQTKAPKQQTLQPVNSNAKAQNSNVKIIANTRQDDYLELLDWTGRHIRDDKPGHIPAHIKNILERLQLNPQHWLTTSQGLGHRFRTAAGCWQVLKRQAAATGRQWIQGMGLAKRMYQAG